MQTNNAHDDKPAPTLDEMLAGIESAMRVPRPLGELMGQVVYLNMWDRTLTFGETTCSLDHPYLDGTKIKAAALEAIGDLKQGAP